MLGLVKAMTWPRLTDNHRWLAGAMEKRIRESNQTPEELTAEARRLRAQAAQTDIKAYREADLALAANYELLAAERLAAA